MLLQDMLVFKVCKVQTFSYFQLDFMINQHQAVPDYKVEGKLWMVFLSFFVCF